MKITLVYKDQGVERILSKKAEQDPKFYENKINAMKHSYAETILARKWLEDGLITKENLLLDDEGNTTNFIAEKTLDDETLNKFKNEAQNIYNSIVVK